METMQWDTQAQNTSIDEQGCTYCDGQKDKGDEGASASREVENQGSYNNNVIYSR